MYKDVEQCLKISKRHIKLMIVDENNLAEIIRATYGDPSSHSTWSRALSEHPDDTVLLFNSPCRLQIAFASTFTPLVLSRDPTIPFECKICRLMCMTRAPIYCGSCDADMCDDCYTKTIEEDLDRTLDHFEQTGTRQNPINIYCKQCDAELVGSWSDVYKVIADHRNILSLSLSLKLSLLNKRPTEIF